MGTKNDLIEAVTKKIAYLPTEDVKFAVDAMFDYMVQELEQSNRVELRGFGSFSIRKRKVCKTEKLYNTIYYRANIKL